MGELAAEKEAIARLIAEYKGSKEEALKEAMEEGKEARFMARVKVPTQKDIEEALIRRKKQELLEMYAIDSDDLDQLEKQAKLTKEAPETTTVKADSNNKENNGTSDNNTTPMNVD